jgi:hypothetical protein
MVSQRLQQFGAACHMQCLNKIYSNKFLFSDLLLFFFSAAPFPDADSFKALQS